jgi:hypothetical protein
MAGIVGSDPEFMGEIGFLKIKLWGKWEKVVFIWLIMIVLMTDSML